MLALAFSLFCSTSQSLDAQGLESLPKVYDAWRTATVKKDYRSWKQLTSQRRQISVRNKIISAKAPFPASIFETPVPPPSIRGLKILKADQKGQTAKVTYFGPVDFGVGGTPTDNLYVVSYINENGRWTYDGAEFVNLMALPEVRTQLNAGTLDYLKSDDFKANGDVAAPTPIDQVQHVAKVYVFCPGRKVEVTVNGSDHTFIDAQEAEIIVGGARSGENKVAFKATRLEGSTGKEAFTVRVYLMNEAPTEKPVKVYEYLRNEGGAVDSSVKDAFQVKG